MYRNNWIQHHAGSSLLAGALLLAMTGGPAPADTVENGEFERPGYQALRFNEDWSGLAGHDRTQTGDLFDPIKYVPLSDDGWLWASFGGQVRFRHEKWRDFGFARSNDDGFELFRTLLHADLHVGENVRFFVQGKSAFATERNLPGGQRGLDVDELDLQNAFVDVSMPFAGGTFTFRPGRQELLFGKQRLVSPLDWSNTRRTFDGFSGILKLEGWKITGFWTRTVPVQKYDFNDQDANTDFYGLYVQGKVPTTEFDLDLYWLGLEKDMAMFNGTMGDERRQTVGGRIGGKLPAHFDFDVEGAFQFGELGSDDISAFMFAAELGHTLVDCPAAPRLHVAFDYASGDHSAGGDVETFNHLFPLGHKYLGWIDVIGRQNIIDLSSGVGFKVRKKTKVLLIGHLFWRADDSDVLYNAGGGVVPRPGTSNDHEVGGEIDLLVKHQFDRHLAALFGYSHFFPGNYIEESGIKSSGIDFFYLSLQYTF
ncbi:MAG: hypothetical protein CMJ18_10985 [Phycisphaeraceae bacterium]|nr:hypothetical protein [Phycisphaeraceae bacterium]